MPRPQYPTTEGLWSRGKREEAGYGTVRLGTPYPAAVENLRKAVEGRTDFDPAVLFVWGTMQATAVLNVLKAVEETFGEAGQELVRKAINQAGYEAMKGFLENSSFPDDVSDIELASYVVTGINTVLYGSLERPWIESENRCAFDILWCPHQDRYSAFDCRVQRFFVEGMFNALNDKGMGRITAWVEKLIPHGAECCHFVVERIGESREKNPWHAYSEELMRRAIRKISNAEHPDESKG
jgi:hypothetical protein